MKKEINQVPVTFKVPVVFEMAGSIDVIATSEEEALDIAYSNIKECKLPKDASYVDDSFSIVEGFDVENCGAIILEMSKDIISHYNTILDKDFEEFEESGIKKDALLYQRDYQYAPNKILSVGVYTGQSNAYVDATLIDDGEEIYSWTGEQLDGEYPSEYGTFIIKGV